MWVLSMTCKHLMIIYATEYCEQRLLTLYPIFPLKNDTFMSVTLLSKILLYKNYHAKIVKLEYLEI